MTTVVSLAVPGVAATEITLRVCAVENAFEISSGLKMDGEKTWGLKMLGLKMEGLKIDGEKMLGLKILGLKIDGV